MYARRITLLNVSHHLYMEIFTVYFTKLNYMYGNILANAIKVALLIDMCTC